MFETAQLNNGIKVVMEKIPFVRSVSFGIFVKNGSRNENKSNNGISHFIEHMLFKGTENRTAKMIADEIDSVGGQINAYTTKEYTCFYTKTLDTHFDTALDVLADMYFNSKFDDEEIKKELNVITEEINMYEDAPEEVVYDILQYNVWENNPLGYSILGSKETISKFNTKIFKDYYKKHYRADNTILSVAGNFETSEILKKIESYFGNMKPTEYKEDTYYSVKYNACSVAKKKEIEQLHLTICFEGIPLGTDETYTLAALNTVFGGGMSSRLFQRIREENGLAYSVYSFASNYIGAGLFNIYAALNPAQLDEVKRLIFEEIELLKINGISKEQLAKTKEQIKSNYILSLESSANRMMSIGKSKLLLNEIKTTDEIIEKVDLITNQKIDSLIGRIFNENKMSMSVVGNI